ncbi:permease [Paenibacillus sp. Marseille-Q4541]|uniref:permease n=1 Tax=Paenibacillus sp. Marseille-Q4541 TaxID=2831522 RepID=UPI001BAE09AD|nr:permease [Paenibacillus sp. Marseille-Q4541]
MNRLFRSSTIGFTCIILLGLSFFFFAQAASETHSLVLSSSLLQLNTIFLSILIEAMPFVLIGVLLAGIIQIFVTEEHITRWMPKNKVAVILMSCVVGALFPACECGIVPIIRRLVSKGVPIYAGIGFMLTGPLINPIVITSTYMAFGNDFRIAGLRMGVGFLIALLVTFFISMSFSGTQFRQHNIVTATIQDKTPLSQKFKNMLHHSIDEFFDMGKFLILGAFIAASVQTFLPAKALVDIATSTASSTLIMMGLAYVLSLCSEADAFIGSSFSHLFGTTSILGFLIFGPMMDLKNTIMMLSVFRARFVMTVLVFIVLTIFTTLMFLHPYL